MINPINYVFYKIHSGLDIIGGGRAPLATTGTISINLTTSIFAIFGQIPNFCYIIIIVVGWYLVSYYYDNEEKILKKYESESESSRKIGNTIVTIYVILTFLIPYLLIRNSN